MICLLCVDALEMDPLLIEGFAYWVRFLPCNAVQVQAEDGTVIVCSRDRFERF